MREVFLLLLLVLCGIIVAAGEAQYDSSQDPASTRVVVTFNTYDACERHAVSQAAESTCSRMLKCYGRRLVLNVELSCLGFSTPHSQRREYNTSSDVSAWIEQQYDAGSVSMVESDAEVVVQADEASEFVVQAELQPEPSSSSYSASSSSGVSSSFSSSHTSSQRAGNESNASTPAAHVQHVQWNLDTIDAYGTWERMRSYGQAATVAVLDSGLAETWLDAFSGRIVDGYDFVSDAQKAGDGDGRDASYYDPGDSVTCSTGSSSSLWHGTKVASVLAANYTRLSFLGVAPQAQTMPVRVLGLCGKGYASDVADGIVWASGGQINGVPPPPAPQTSVILMSLSGRGPCPSFLQTAVDLALSRNVSLYAAAGNDPLSDASTFFPGNCRGVTSVGAINRAGRVASYSARGAAAYMPGGGDDGGGVPCLGDSREALGYCVGTSVAAAHAAGLRAVTGEQTVWFVGDTASSLSSEQAAYPSNYLLDGEVEAAFYTTTTNLFVWYRFNTDATNMLVDSSGQGNTLINSGGAFNRIIFEVGGGSIFFAGTASQHAVMPATVNPSTIQSTVGISFSVWFKMSTTSGIWARVFEFSNQAVARPR